MNEPEKEVEYVCQKLFKDNELVTYSGLSRVLDIPISRSKSILYDVFRSNKSKLDASFIIVGLKNNTKTIQFVQTESSVDSELNEFQEVLDVHIYAITLLEYSYSKSDIVTKQLDSKVDLSNLDQFYSQGHIKGPSLESSNHHIQTHAPVREEKSKVIKEEPKEVKKTNKTFNTGLSSNYVSRKAQKPGAGTDITKFASSATKRDTEPPKYQYKSRKLENKKEKVVISDDVDPIGSDNVSGGVQKLDAESKNKLAAMFDDDFSDEEMKDEPEEDIVANTEPEESEKDVDVVMESVDDENSIMHKLPINKNPTPVPEPEPEQSSEPQYDEDGYIITHRPKKAAAKPKSAVRPSKPAKPATSSSKPGNKKQSSLMNFFGKKN